MKYKTIFLDLDETIYPSSSGLWEAIRNRLDLFLHDQMQFSWEEIPELRKSLFAKYGTTLRGLQALYKIDEMEYLAFVHDVPLEFYIKPDESLRHTLLKFPQQKFIFTNADANHARRVLDIMNLTDCVDGIIDILDIAPYCKPMPESFHIALKCAGEDDPAACILVDDSINNLSVARKIGFYTIRVGSDEVSPEYHRSICLLRDLQAALQN
jgi:putative hydrolase of the HAD superfamily